jgi:hypothetical protein
MNHPKKKLPTSLLWGLLTLFLVLAFFWIRAHYFEQRWVAEPYQSDAARDKPMLAAIRLLEQHQFKVQQSQSIEQAIRPSLNTSHLFLGDTNGEFNPVQAKQVLAWVQAGNTLIMLPRWTGVVETENNSTQECIETKPSDKDTDKAKNKAQPKNVPDSQASDETTPEVSTEAQLKTAVPKEPDPIASRFKVETHRILRTFPPPSLPSFSRTVFPAKTPVNCVTELRWPNLPYALHLDGANNYLVSLQDSVPAIIADQQQQQALRVYREGNGYIVLLANNYFNNINLPLYDHAQLLLLLTELKPGKRGLVIIDHLQVRQWYEKLWSQYFLFLLSLALGLMLLLWQNMRRFGAVLPLPEANRRALMEHIDASGRWLWKMAHGKQILLDATRKLTYKTLHRRLPKLARLTPTEQIECLLQDTKINRTALEMALQSQAASVPLVFIRQIHTLQRLRKHYER